MRVYQFNIDELVVEIRSLIICEGVSDAGAIVYDTGVFPHYM